MNPNDWRVPDPGERMWVVRRTSRLGHHMVVEGFADGVRITVDDVAVGRMPPVDVALAMAYVQGVDDAMARFLPGQPPGSTLEDRHPSMCYVGEAPPGTPVDSSGDRA